MRRIIPSPVSVCRLRSPRLPLRSQHWQVQAQRKMSKQAGDTGLPDHTRTDASSRTLVTEAPVVDVVARDRAIRVRHGGNTPGYQIETNQNWYLEHGHKTWGWPIYRTCYDDDEKWKVFQTKFNRILLQDMRYYFPAEEAEQRSKYLNFPTWENRAEFEGATTAQLRAHYLGYLQSDAPFEEQGLVPGLGSKRDLFFRHTFCRYEYFLMADAASIASVVNAPDEPTLWLSENTPWINAVEVKWPPKDDPDDPDDTPWDINRGHELIEGMDTYNVGFHRIAIESLYPSHWAQIDEGSFTFDEWYVRPPGIVYHP